MTPPVTMVPPVANTVPMVVPAGVIMVREGPVGVKLGAGEPQVYIIRVLFNNLMSYPNTIITNNIMGMLLIRRGMGVIWGMGIMVTMVKMVKIMATMV